jgi:hypothetical protein
METVVEALNQIVAQSSNQVHEEVGAAERFNMFKRPAASQQRFRSKSSVLQFAECPLVVK